MPTPNVKLKCVSESRVQPVPHAISIGHMNGVTAITRHFAPEAVPHCRLCPASRCCWHAGCCTVLVSGVVPDREAALFDLTVPAGRPGIIRVGGRNGEGAGVGN